MIVLRNLRCKNCWVRIAVGRCKLNLRPVAMPQLSVRDFDALPPSNSVRARLVPLREELKRACPEQSLRRDVPILDICDCDCRPYTATQHRPSCMPFHRGTIDQSGFRKPSDCCRSENNTSSSSAASKRERSRPRCLTGNGQGLRDDAGPPCFGWFLGCWARITLLRSLKVTTGQDAIFGRIPLL